MLQQFTWQQFLIAALLLSLIWYAVLILLFYRKKLNDGLKKRLPGGPRSQSSYNPRADDEDHARTEPEANDLIGKTAQPEGVTEVEMNMFSFAPKEDIDQDQDRDARLGLIPDVLEEIKTISSILETEGGSKEDFISLFKLINSKYPGIKDSKYRQSLDEHIRQSLPFEISQEELDKLWS